MILLGVSGGPDSMFLLDEYKKKQIVVAHVNYNLRKSSKRDEKIVEMYCEKFNIPFKLLSINEKPIGNTEAWARKIRYDFFNKIYSELDCNKVLLAHHRDDFLETGMMQQLSKRVPRYYGIRKRRIMNGMVVCRPFIDLYWKKEILKKIEKKKIIFGIDETNSDLSLSRNKIRHEISGWSMSKKRSHVSWLKMSNKILKKKFKKVDIFYENWKQSHFSIKKFKKINKYKEELVFELIHEKFKEIKLSKTKIESIVDFIEGSEGNKQYKLKENIYLIKKNGFVF